MIRARMRLNIEISFHIVSYLLLGIHSKDVQGTDDKVKIMDPEEHNFYTYPAMDIYENIISLDKYRGKVSLVVNVASHCGYTDTHYAGLNMLQELYEHTEAFTVLAFPCNQFGGQEPGNHHQIYEFAYKRMGANFPVFAKVNVLDRDIPPAWAYLIDKTNKAPTWNFWKYLVNHDGDVIGAWGPSYSPDQLYGEIEKAVAVALKAREEKEGNKKEEKTSKNLKDEF